jgi:hypothetical protein
VRYFEQRPERLERVLASRESEVVVALLQFSNESVIGWKDKHFRLASSTGRDRGGVACQSGGRRSGQSRPGGVGRHSAHRVKRVGPVAGQRRPSG